jgi:hypothetical protein
MKTSCLQFSFFISFTKNQVVESIQLQISMSNGFNPNAPLYTTGIMGIIF